MLKKSIMTFLFLAVLSYVLILVALYFSQERLIFPGTKLPDDYRFQFDLPFTEVNIPVEGGQLNALHFQQENPKGVVFFLHGNAGHLVDWTTNVDFYQKVNYDLFIFDYRGYGKSSGKVNNQQQLFNDINTAWQFIQPQYKNKKTVIFGRSIGTALATQLAKEVNTDLVVLASPFTSMNAMLKKTYPFVPKALLKYPLETDTLIQHIKAPVVFLHGDQDFFIPQSHSEILHRLRKEQQLHSELIIIEGADHGDIHQFEQYNSSLADVLP